MEQLRPPEIIKPPVLQIPNEIINQNPENRIQNTVIPPTHTKEFSISDMKEDSPTIKIDFLASDKPNDFIKQPTDKAKPEAPGMEPNYINPQNNSTGTNPLNPLKSKEEVRSSVSTLIAIIDYALSFVGQLIASEGTQSQYTADASQKKLLETALTDYFYEKQVKMSTGFALFLAFLGAYGFMLIGASKKRFDLIKAKKNPNYIPKKEAIPKPKTEPPAKGPLTEKEIAELQKITPKVSPPVYKPTLDTIYIENKKDGTLEPQKFPKWLNPDAKLIATSKNDLENYIMQGIYPMFLKNINNNKHRKINYDRQTGRPVYIGKPARVK